MFIQRAICGTKEQFDRYKNKLNDAYKVIPVTFYVSETTIFLETSKEWVDWLTAKTDIIPINNSNEVIK